MSNFPDLKTQIQQADAKLGERLYTNGRYNAMFLFVTGLGFLVIYLLTLFNILGQPSPQLLYIGGTVILLGILQIPVVNLARQKRGIAANFLESLSVIFATTLLAAFWEGILPFAIMLLLITLLTGVMAGMPRRYYPALGLLYLAGIVAILFVNTHPLIIRLQTSTTPAIASLAFLATTVALLLTVTITARSNTFRSLRNQLLTSFIIIATIPTLLATILSAVSAYTNNEAQVFNVLETVSSLKKNQIDEVISGLTIDAARINQDTAFSRDILNILTSKEQLARSIVSAARSRLLNFQLAGETGYDEIMVLNLRGVVVVSTDSAQEGKTYQSELFYREGSIGAFTSISKNPLFGNSNLIFATPIYDTDGKIIRGILVLRAKSKLIKDIVESTPGFSEIETYLLDQGFEPLTKTRFTTETVHTPASEAILGNGRVAPGRGTYINYYGDQVLGYYQKIEALNAAFIAEVPRSYVLQSSVNSLLGSSALALFAIAIAVAAVAISAASIAAPISALAKSARSFAAGNLTSRASINRRDEIGALGSTYDQMANQLQDIIGRLEQRVSDRTRELENQTVRLHIAAEIARDTASSHNLDELLERSGTLIQEHFGLYQTGIYLLDQNREYAVLNFSPTEAGRQMLANGHKFRLGEVVGIVGRVASSGEARISLDTGVEATHFNNPYLPNTRSEMALPLKVEKNVIGVLDLQSDQPQAFDESDIAVMQILADQLAAAIERTRLLEQVEHSLSDLEQAYGQFTREGWKTLGETGLLSQTGYRFDNVRIQPISQMPESGDEALKSGEMVIQNNDDQASGTHLVAIPIKLRGQTIGVVTANLKDGYNPATISTLQLAIERLALSLESARLYEEARLRADREQTIAQVASNISSSTDYDEILQTTVREIGKLMADTEVAIQIISDSDEPKSSF